MPWFPISLFKHKNAHSSTCFGHASTNNLADTTVHFHTQTLAIKLVQKPNMIKPHLCNLTTYINHQGYLHYLISSLSKYNYIPAARFSFLLIFL